MDWALSMPEISRNPAARLPVTTIMHIPIKLARLLSVSLLCATGLAAQVCRSPAGSKNTADQPGVNVPIKIHGGVIFVPVVLNDGHAYSFLLDSEFEDSVIDPATAKALHLTSADEHTEAAPGGAVKTSSVAGVERSVAGLALGKSTLSSLDLSGFDPLLGQHLDGVLGYDFFRQFVVVIDYPHGKLTLCDPASFRPGSEQPVTLHLESKQPYIDVQMEGANGTPIQTSLEIDTGKVDPFSVSAAFARKNGLLQNPSSLFALKGISVGGETQAWMTRAKYVDFANVSIKNPVMGIVEEDADRAGQLGYGVLKRFKITLDYSRKKAYFEPGPDFSNPYEFDHAGLILGTGGPNLSILLAFMVIAGTPAADAGIRQGDEIVTINNRPATAFTLEEARHYFEHATGPQTLTLRRNGSTLTVSVICRPLV
jgi:hypothetical protein